MNRILILIVILLFSGISEAQIKNSRMSRYGFEINKRPKIFYNTFISYKNGLNFDFSLKIQNDVLQFKKVADVFKAKYEISLHIRDFKEQQTLFSEIWQETVELNDFIETNATKIYQNARKSFNLKLKPGKYKLLVELSDLQTGNNLFSKRSLEILDQSKNKIKHGSLVFVEQMSKDKRNVLISSSANKLELGSSPNVLFEYATQEGDSLKINSKLYRLDELNNILLYNEKYTVTANRSFLRFMENIKETMLEEGEYVIKYTLANQTDQITLQDTFKVVWHDKPVYLYKYDLALRPMIYLLSEEEYEKADDLPLSELEVWFENFWKQKDDRPETIVNEVKYEFYNRVQKAIDRFSLRFKEGWRTERGETLILYGEPDRIEKFHHVINTKPYEIWYYEDLNKKITFIDRLENEDFKLASIENIKD